MLAPAMIAVGIATIIVGQTTIYQSQLPTRADSPAHRLQLSFPLLSTLAIQQAMTPLIFHFSPLQTIAEAEHLLAERNESGAVVVDAQNNLLGVITQADIQRITLAERPQQLVQTLMTRNVLTAYPDATLDEALELLTSHRVSWMPIIDVEATTGGQKVIGVLNAADIVHAYRATLAKDDRRMRGLVVGTVMIETKVEAGMPLVERPLREARLPAECLVISIRRREELLFPRGSTVILPGDMVTFLVSPQGETALQKYLATRTVASTV
jgi:chloride channel protein, CIC family